MNQKTKIKLLVPVLAVFGMLGFAQVSHAADHYVRAGATGANNGSDWNNAYTALPATLVRGATYYVADGSYGGYTFNTAHNGTQLITIKKATKMDHGANSGWQDSFAGQAVFGSIQINRGYVVIDGSYRDENNWQNTNSYGFRLTGGVTSNTAWDANATQARNVTVRYLDIGQPSGGTCTSSTPGSGVYVGFSNQANWFVSHCHIHDVQIPIVTVGANSFTLEYSHIGPSWAKEAISNQNATGWIIRHNVFLDNLIYPPDDCKKGGDGATADIWTRSSNTANDNWSIYGNVFADSGIYNNIMRTNAVLQGNYYGGGDWLVSGWKVYNNTFYNIQGGNNRINLGAGTNNVVANNLWYKSRSSAQSIGIANSGAGAQNLTQWCDSTPYNLCPSSPGMWIAGSDNPFINADNFDFRLRGDISGNSPINAGTALGAGFDPIDAFGNIRGADGGWDIGAYEYVSGAEPSCGDGTCNGTEDCTSCSDDCGVCPRTYGLADFIALLADWLTPGDEDSDVNQDNIVNARDLGIMMSGWE